MNIIDECFNGDGTKFISWRYKLAELQGIGFVKYGHLKVPDIDWEYISSANILGIWDDEPSNPLDILYAHSTCEGHIFRKDINAIIGMLHALLENNLGNKLCNKKFINTTKECIALLKMAYVNNIDIYFTDNSDG